MRVIPRKKGHQMDAPDTTPFQNMVKVQDAVQDLIAGEWPSDDGEVADLTGLVRAEEVRLADFRRLLLSESQPASGSAYKIVESRSAKRTYNTGRILSDFMAADDTDMLTTLFELMRSGALKLTWGWTKLKGEFEKRDVSMVTASHEIEDGANLDDPHIGEVWEKSTRVEAK